MQSMTNAQYQNRIAVGNLPSAPSLMDRARKQSKANGTAVMYRAPFGFRTALPQDEPGDINLYYSGRFDDVQESLIEDGYTVEVLGLEMVA